MKNEKIWMMTSGACGITFFLLANWARVLGDGSIVAGCAQLVVNAFVLFAWGRAFLAADGLKRAVAFFGVAVPLVMAGTTICRVIVPWFVQ